MFTRNTASPTASSDQQLSVKHGRQTASMTADDLDLHRERIAVMCMKKCLTDADQSDVDARQRICMSRCAFKLVSSIQHANRLCDLFERRGGLSEEKREAAGQENKLN
jgi:hypothetical protein